MEVEIFNFVQSLAGLPSEPVDKDVFLTSKNCDEVTDPSMINFQARVLQSCGQLLGQLYKFGLFKEFVFLALSGTGGSPSWAE